MVGFPNSRDWAQNLLGLGNVNNPLFGNVNNVPRDNVPPSGSLGGGDQTPPVDNSNDASQNSGRPNLQPGNTPPGGYGSLSLQSFKLDAYSLQGLAKVLFDASLE